MVKKLNGYLLMKKVRHKFLAKVCPFAGAKVSCMIDHVKPTIRHDKPDHVILHTGTNDLRNEKTASQIARSITELVMSLENNDNSVIVSGIVPRNKNLNNKATDVNIHLLVMCKEREIPFIAHSENIDSIKHLNERELHLNHNGIKAFAEYFPVFLKKFKKKISLHTSVNLNSERKSHVLETPDRDLCRKNSFTSPEEELNNLRLKTLTG